ncbi:unnamed protein product [Amaranthus hypochondriacus]
MKQNNIEMRMVAIVMFMFLYIQFAPSFEQDVLAPSQSGLPPAPTPMEGRCWDDISACIVDHVNNTESNPEWEPLSSSFNITEFLCCPLIEQTSTTEKECFCTITTFLDQNPSQAPNITQLLTLCGIINNSVIALHNFCLGEGPSPAVTPMMPPGNS